MHRAVAAAASCLLGSALALVGCGQTEPPEPPATSSSSSSSSASPSASAAPTMPAAAKRHTKAGAIAFVRHYIDTLNFAAGSLQTSGLRKLSSPDCVKCERIAYGIDEIKKASGAITGNEWRIRRFQFYGTDGSLTRLDVYVDTNAGTTQRSMGSKITTNPPQRNHLHAFALSKHGHAWRVTQLDPEVE